MRVNIKAGRKNIIKPWTNIWSEKNGYRDGQGIYKGLYDLMMEPVVSHNIGNSWQVWTHTFTGGIFLVLTHILIQETQGYLS